MNSATEQITVFKRSSTTYFNSSLFFPPEVRGEVSVLYAFVRMMDDRVDASPQDAEGFFALRRAYVQTLDGFPSGNKIIDDFVELKKRRKLEDSWIESFLDAMEADLTVREYRDEAELLGYIHGSAEVVGLFMCAILGLPPEAHPAAIMQGRAMQYINFIRDIAEDLGLGRRYLHLAGSGLSELTEKAARSEPEAFGSFVAAHLRRFRDFQADADRGYRYIPYRYRIAIRTARDMYAWTAGVISKKPLAIFERKIKPHKIRVILSATANAFLELFR